VRWLLVLALLTGCASWVDAPGNLRARTLVVGQQAEIDAGHAVNYTGCWPGQNCTVFLAGHRSSHGSVFAGVANLQPGDPVRVGYDGKVWNYRVDEHVIVDQHTQVSDVLRGDLVLQTSAGGSRVHLFYCSLET
jgi:hypothetical protein